MKIEFKKNSNILSNKTFDNIAMYSRELDYLIEELIKANTRIKWEINRQTPNIELLNSALFHAKVCIKVTERKSK
jgi:hypothetical protein